MQFNPTQANALFMKAQMYFTLGEYQKALNELLHLDKIHPKLALVNYTMAKAYHHLGQKYLGNKHMQIANELDPKGNHKQKGKRNISEKIKIKKKNFEATKMIIV